MDQVTLLEQAGERTAKIVEQISKDQLSSPTPCTDWDVRAVLNHLVGENKMFAMGLAGESLPDMAGGLPDFVGDDPAGAYRTSFEASLAEWRKPGAMDKTLELPVGTTPSAFAVGLHFMDTLVHGWDLAKGTGQDTTLDPELASVALGMMRELFSHGPMPESVFKPSIPIGDDAPVGDQLVALLGRRP